MLGLVRIPFFELRYKSASNIRSFGGRGLNIFFSLIKAGISVRLSVCLHFYYVKNRSSNRLHAWQVCCCDAVSHFGAIGTRDTFRINKLLINYRTARAGSGAPHAGRAYMLRERTLHWYKTHRSVKSNTFNKVAQCLICKLRGFPAAFEFIMREIPANIYWI